MQAATKDNVLMLMTYYCHVWLCIYIKSSSRVVARNYASHRILDLQRSIPVSYINIFLNQLINKPTPSVTIFGVIIYYIFKLKISVIYFACD